MLVQSLPTLFDWLTAILTIHNGVPRPPAADAQAITPVSSPAPFHSQDENSRVNSANSCGNALCVLPGQTVHGTLTLSFATRDVTDDELIASAASSTAKVPPISSSSSSSSPLTQSQHGPSHRHWRRVFGRVLLQPMLQLPAHTHHRHDGTRYIHVKEVRAGAACLLEPVKETTKQYEGTNSRPSVMLTYPFRFVVPNESTVRALGGASCETCAPHDTHAHSASSPARSSVSSASLSMSCTSSSPHENDDAGAKDENALLTRHFASDEKRDEARAGCLRVRWDITLAQPHDVHRIEHSGAHYHSDSPTVTAATFTSAEVSMRDVQRKWTRARELATCELVSGLWQQLQRRARQSSRSAVCAQQLSLLPRTSNCPSGHLHDNKVRANREDEPSSSCVDDSDAADASGKAVYGAIAGQDRDRDGTDARISACVNWTVLHVCPALRCHISTTRLHRGRVLWSVQLTNCESAGRSVRVRRVVVELASTSRHTEMLVNSHDLCADACTMPILPVTAPSSAGLFTHTHSSTNARQRRGDGACEDYDDQEDEAVRESSWRCGGGGATASDARAVETLMRVLTIRFVVPTSFAQTPPSSLPLLDKAHHRIDAPSSCLSNGQQRGKAVMELKYRDTDTCQLVVEVRPHVAHVLTSSSRERRYAAVLPSRAHASHRVWKPTTDNNISNSSSVSSSSYAAEDDGDFIWRDEDGKEMASAELRSVLAARYVTMVEVYYTVEGEMEELRMTHPVTWSLVQR